MANPNFIPNITTNEIYRDLDQTACLTDELDRMDGELDDLNTGKADNNHRHSFNDLSDQPTIPTIPSSLPANGGNADTVDGKHADEFAPASHGHSGFASENHSHSDYALVNHTHDIDSTLLWSGNNGTGGYYMTEGHTVTPSKKLSECRNGWMLLWSRYDTSSGTAKNDGFCTTMIPKIAPTGTNWAGHSFSVDVVGTYATATPYSDTRFMKWLYVWDDKLVGRNQNDEGGRNAVVLRAVYEF